jgi:hypothetical protein
MVALTWQPQAELFPRERGAALHASCAQSHALTNCQSRLTVRCVTPRPAAISSICTEPSEKLHLRNLGLRILRFQAIQCIVDEKQSLRRQV